mgnify:FL=1
MTAEGQRSLRVGNVPPIYGAFRSNDLQVAIGYSLGEAPGDASGTGDCWITQR